MADTSPRSFRALFGDHAFDLTLQGGQVILDGETLDCTFTRHSERIYTLLVEGRSFPVTVEALDGDQVRVTLEGRQVDVRVRDEKALLLEKFGLADDAGAAEREVHAPMPGLVLSIAVEPGQSVAAGDSLLVLEAMKMENELRAHHDAVVKAVHVAPGEAVSKNALLIEFEA